MCGQSRMTSTKWMLKQPTDHCNEDDTPHLLDDDMGTNIKIIYITLWLSMASITQSLLSSNDIIGRGYSSWHRMSHFWDFLVFWPLFGLKHWVWGSNLVTSNVTMPKLTFRRKFHWKMHYFWAFYHSKFRRKIIHFFIEWVTYLL